MVTRRSKKATEQNDDSVEEILRDDIDSDAAIERILKDSESGKAALKTLANTYDGWSDDNVLSTGICEVDVATGIGGFPYGRFVEIYGDESAGKTTMFLHTVASAQRKGIPVVYIDSENALDLDYCAKLGVDVNKMLVNQPESLEEALDLMINTMKSEHGNAFSKNAGRVLFVFDSVPAIKSMEVMEKTAGERSMMAEARVWTENGPKLISWAGKTGSIILLVNQTRVDKDATAAKYAKKVTPGGKFLKFAATQRLEISAKKRLEEKDKGGPPLGQDTTVKFVKNKVGGPGKKAEYFLPAGEPVVWSDDVVKSAIKVGVALKDKKFDKDAGELIDSKNGYVLPLQEGWIDLIREDELDLWLEDGELDAQEAAIASGEVDDNGDPVQGENLNTIENFQSKYSDDQEYISIRFENPFLDTIAEMPRLVHAMEKAVLAKVREKKVIAETRKVRPSGELLSSKRLLTVAEKRALAEKEAKAAPKVDTEAAPDGATETAEGEVKRGRGRPRKDATAAE